MGIGLKINADTQPFETQAKAAAKKVSSSVTSTIKVSADGKSVTQLNKTLEKTVDDTGKVTSKMQAFNSDTGQVTTTVKQSSTAVKGLGEDFVDTLGKVAKFGAVTAVIGAFTAAISTSIQMVKEYDDALTEFKKVSDLTGDSLQEYSDKLADMGEKTGSTVTDMVSASTEFKKSGYSDSDAAQLASIAEMYRNIADEEIGAGESATFIISQMKSFGDTAQEAQHIIDGVNEVNKLAFE